MVRLQPARRGARTSQTRVLRFLLRERERARVALFDLRTCQVSFSFGGRGWHVGVRPCTEGDDRPADAVGFREVTSDSNQHGGTRASPKHASCASSTFESERSGSKRAIRALYLAK